ncbi:MAG: site-specific integrase [Actinomycetota bacterium]|nr:site-specific integrase [Actinomycetota bacterium]
MTPPVQQPAAAPTRLLEKLLSAVRPEFRVDVYVPAPGDPVLGRPACSVNGCDRSGWEYGLCPAHGSRWRAQGRPDLASFAAVPGPELNGRRALSRCTVKGCRFGTSGFGLCMRHRSTWTSSKEPDPARWAGTVPAVSAVGRTECQLPFCDVWAENDKHLFCKSHHTRWHQLGRPDPEQYQAHCLLRGKARIDFRPLAGQLKLEFQYAVQCRHDQQTITAPPPVVTWALRLAANSGVVSLLDYEAQHWRERCTHKSGGWYEGFLLHAHEVVEMLRDGTGWDVEYPRDVWRLHTLPGLTRNAGHTTDARNQLRFDRLSQPWLRALAKRWCRLRLSSGLTVGTVVSDVTALTRFSMFLEHHAADVTTLADLDRSLLERYLAWVSTQTFGDGAKDDCITTLGALFQAIRQHDWDDSLPTTAVFFAGDIPRRPPRLSRQLAEFVMAQVEAPANLDRWPHPHGRLLTLILIRCGLRASDGCTLAFDCLIHDGQGAPYLRYFNHKMRREAAVPIDEELQAEIRSQQQRVVARWPEAHPHLFPATHGNANGQRPLTYYSYRMMLTKWLADCEVRDEHGQPARLTPHQWRHTFACRLINRDVPQEVVRILLDHESTQMTAHYARITDQTVRRRWEQATKVNINGERVTLDPDGPLAQAQWAKTRYGIATQTLPHGYCGLPVQKSCPHANACLTCPVFLTGPEFLPELREHRGRTLTLIDQAECSGHTRVLEMNQQVLTNLDRVISEVETVDPDESHDEVADAG